MKKTELTLDHVNPYEVRRGLHIELESIDKEDKDRRNKATKKVLENLSIHPAYYSELENYNTMYRNEPTKPSFKKHLKEKNKETDMIEVKLRESVKKLAKQIIKEEYTEYLPDDKKSTNNSRLLNQVQGSLNTLANELRELAAEYSKNKDKAVVGKMKRYNEERKQLESVYNKLLASELNETDLSEISIPYSPVQVISTMKEAIDNFEMVMKNISLNGWMGEQVGVNERKKIERNYMEVKSHLTALEESLDEMLDGWKS
jgi:hypothetical protein